MANEFDKLNTGLPYVGSDNVNYATEVPYRPESEEERIAREQEEAKQQQALLKAESEQLKVEKQRIANEKMAQDIQDKKAEAQSPNTILKSPFIEEKVEQPVIEASKVEQPKATTYQDLIQQLNNLEEEKKKGLDKAKWIDLASNLGQAFAQYATTRAYGKAGKTTGGYTKEPTLQKTKATAYSDLLARYQADRASIADKVKILKVEEKGKSLFPKDPNDPVNVREREKYKQMYPGLTVPDLATGDDLTKGISGMISNRRMDEYYKDKIALGRKNLTEREDEHVRKWWNDNQEDIKKTIKEFNKDKVVETSRVKIANIQKVRDVLNSKNPIGDASITNFLARASGEVGALTEEDKKPFKGSRAIVNTVSRIAKEYANGLLTDSDRKYMMDLSDTYEKADLRILGKRADNMAKQYGKIDFPTELLRDRFLGTAAQEYIPFDYPTKDQPPIYSDQKQPKKVVRKGYNAKTNQTQFIYSDGSKEIVEGRR